MRRCALHLLLLLLLAVAAKRRKDWSKVRDKDWDDVDGEWEKGDERDELVTEDHLLYEQMEERRKNIEKLGVPDEFDERKHPESYLSAQQAMAGPSMMFATMNMTKRDGREMTKDDTDELAAMWKERLYLAGLEVTMYDIEADKILVTLKTGWRGKDVKEFILEQPEVLELEWNSKKFHPPHISVETKRKLAERQRQKQRQPNNKQASRKKKKKRKKRKKASRKKKKSELR